jgi:hypothetical protein
VPVEKGIMLSQIPSKFDIADASASELIISIPCYIFTAFTKVHTLHVYYRLKIFMLKGNSIWSIMSRHAKT